MRNMKLTVDQFQVWFKATKIEGNCCVLVTRNNKYHIVQLDSISHALFGTASIKERG